MTLNAPASLYPTSSYAGTTSYSHDDMASLVASTSSGFTGLDTQHHYHQQPQYQQNPLSHGSQAHAQAHAQAQAAAAQQQGQLSQSLAGVGRRHRTVPAKTFKCTGFGDCAMVFSRSEHLARHVRKHTGERPFACHCSKQFSRLDNLRQHAQTVHADRPELNSRMMARLVEVQGTMATLGKAPTSSSADSSAGSAKPHPPRALALSLSLDTNTNMSSSLPSAHIKSEGGSPDLSLLPPQHPHLSLQQRKARRGFPLTLSSADIAAANLHAGFHLQGHATAPLPHGHAYGHGHGYNPPLSSPHGSAYGGNVQEQYPAAPHSASAHQTHFPHTQTQAFAQSFSLDALAPAHHVNVHRGRGVEFTQSEYGYKVPSHGHAHGAHSEYATSTSGSPGHEFPFYADANPHPTTQALPSPPYSAASASGYFPSVPQKMEEIFEQAPQAQATYIVKQEEVAAFDFPHHPAHAGQQQHSQLHHQHSQTWSSAASASSHSPNPQSHAAYVSPPITPHLANFPSLSITGGSRSSGSMSPHSAFSASPVVPPAFERGSFDGSATYEAAPGFESGGYEGSSGYESSLSPEQAAFESGFVHAHQQQFDGKFEQHVEQHFEHQQQQQQQEYYHAAEHQHQQQQEQQQQRWMAQQQYRHEHGFAT